mmetsp:Transcript_99675/g.197612  ORF Transcript_99675/g.197612 Transcript_99675/m.197612 type:complete len:213 (-) Transcript_99675:376-1014(-)
MGLPGSHRRAKLTSTLDRSSPVRVQRLSCGGGGGLSAQRIPVLAALGSRTAPATLAPVLVVMWIMKWSRVALTADNSRSSLPTNSLRRCNSCPMLTSSHLPASRWSTSAITSSASHMWQRCKRNTCSPQCNTFWYTEGTSKTFPAVGSATQLTAGKNTIAPSSECPTTPPTSLPHSIAQRRCLGELCSTAHCSSLLPVLPSTMNVFTLPPWI